MKALKFLAIILVVLSCSSVYSQISQDSKGSDDSKESFCIYDKLPVNPKTNAKFRYFYYPNMQAYYDNLNHVYYFKQDGQWMINDELPSLYGGYSLYSNRKVIIEDFMGDKPYELIQVHKTKYPYNSKGRFNNA